MNYLLDTHVLLWYIEGESRLSKKSLKTIDDKNFIKIISIASLWEIAIKINEGKLNTGMSFDALDRFISLNHFEILPVKFGHLAQLKSLPNHHSDPFDHLLIAQAIIENLTIISADRHFQSYPVNVIW